MKKLLTLSALALASFAFAQGAFQYARDVDPITDRDSSLIATFGTTNRDAALVWACKEEGLRVLFVPDDYIGSNDFFDVTYRFDKNAASVPRGWSASTNGQAVFLPQNLTKSFTAAAKRAQSITVRVTDYAGSYITHSFSLTGLTQALAKLSCARGF